MSRQSEIAEILLDMEAVQIRPDRPFTWASGLRAPLYCDNRLVISHVDQRRRICRSFVDLIAEHDWQPDVIAGTATAGIPHAAWLADALNLPMTYVRGKAKSHGRENRIEGRLHTGARVLLIEDLISTGGSVLSAAQAIVDAGGRVLAVCAIFQYGLHRARAAFDEAGITLRTLTSLDDLIHVLKARRRLTADQWATLKRWQTDPVAWSDDHASH